MTRKKVVIIGAGGHAKVVASTAIANGLEVVGFFVPEAPKVKTSILNIPVLGMDELETKKALTPLLELVRTI